MDELFDQYDGKKERPMMMKKSRLNPETLRLDFFAAVFKSLLERASSLREIPSRFVNHTEYIHTFLPMIIEEAVASLEQSVDTGIRVECDQINRWSSPFYYAVCSADTARSIRANEVLLITDSARNHFWGFSKRSSITDIMMYCPLTTTPKKGSWICTSMGEMTSSLREFTAIQQIPTSPLVNSIIGKIKGVQKVTTDVPSIDSTLNPSQREAIRTAVGRSDGITLIQGPPGTGKTRTIIGILRALLTIEEEVKGGILVCAPSNIAADELTLRLLDLGPSVNIVRVSSRGRGECCSRVLLDRLSGLEKSANLKTLEKEIYELGAADAAIQGYHSYALDSMLNRRDLLRKIHHDVQMGKQDEVIRSADIILCTLSMSASFAILRSRCQFATVIIDEAAQAVEPSTIIPLNYGARRLVMVGDPCQLPATVLSLKAINHGYSRSLFERLRTLGRPVHLLDTQYRMHPEIRRFPARYFYEDKIKDGGIERTAIFHDNWYQAPYLFFDVHGVVETASGTSVYNDAEARLALLMVDGIPPNNVAILSPYRAQVEKIAYDNNRVEVATIDGYQGRETDIVVLSCVRTKTETSTIGFLSDRRRMNVALTRARQSMWIIGNAEALRTHPDWAELISDALERNVYVRTTPTGDGFTAVLGDHTHYFCPLKDDDV